MTDKTDIAALRPSERAKLGFVTDDNTGGYYVAECEECGKIFPSQTCDGGGEIADSGDYGDCYCPHCGFIDPLECDNANLVWNVQQLKIVNLTKQLEAERQRVDAACHDIRIQANDLKSAQTVNKVLQATLAELKGEQVPVAWKLSDSPDTQDCTVTQSESVAKWWVEQGRNTTPLFTAPQKPIISKEKFCDWLEDNFDIDDSQRDAFANCFAHHCNCIVKEGE